MEKDFYSNHGHWAERGVRPSAIAWARSAQLGRSAQARPDQRSRTARANPTALLGRGAGGSAPRAARRQRCVWPAVSGRWLSNDKVSTIGFLDPWHTHLAWCGALAPTEQRGRRREAVYRRQRCGAVAVVTNEEWQLLRGDLHDRDNLRTRPL
jgi:hypothetical protein